MKCLHARFGQLATQVAVVDLTTQLVNILRYNSFFELSECGKKKNLTSRSIHITCTDPELKLAATIGLGDVPQMVGIFDEILQLFLFTSAALVLFSS